MTTTQQPRRSAMRDPVLRAIIIAETISTFGTQMTFVALPWFVLVTTGSETKMGLVFAVELVPVALLGIPSALLVQRLGVRRTLLTCDLLRAPVLAAVPVLHLLDQLSFPVLLAVVFASGLFTAPYVSAQRLVIPETFGQNESLVVQGNALLEGAARLATLAGPATAGALISLVGATNVLWIDAATFLASFAILLRYLPVAAVPMAAAATGSSRGALAGARFVLASPLLRRVSAGALLSGFFFPMLLASLPVVAHERHDASPTTAGLLFAVWGGGSLLGAVIATRLADRVDALRMAMVAVVGMAVPLWALPFPLAAWQFALAMLVSGIFVPIVNAPLITLILLRTPEELRAQVITFVITASLLAGPLGYALAGPGLEYAGLTVVLLVAAAGNSLAALLLFTIRRTLEPASRTRAA